MNKFNYTIQERNKDARLCKAYRTGDETAFVMMCERYDEIAFQPAIHWVREDYSFQGYDTQYIDEEDILQEAKIAMMTRMRDPNVYRQIEKGIFKSMVHDSVLKAMYNYLYNTCAYKETTVPDDNFEIIYEDPFDTIEKGSLKENLEMFINELTQREYAVIKRRLSGETLRQIAEYYNVSTERIRQTHSKACRKIRGKINRYNSKNMFRINVYRIKSDKEKSIYRIAEMYRSSTSFKELITPILLPKYIHPECLMGVRIKEYALPSYKDHQEEWDSPEFLKSIMKELNEFTLLVYKKLGFKIVSNDEYGVRVVLPYDMKFNESRYADEIRDKNNKAVLYIQKGQVYDKFSCSYDNQFTIVKINNSVEPHYLKSIYF